MARKYIGYDIHKNLKIILQKMTKQNDETYHVLIFCERIGKWLHFIQAHKTIN